MPNIFWKTKMVHFYEKLQSSKIEAEKINSLNDPKQLKLN